MIRAILYVTLLSAAALAAPAAAASSPGSTVSASQLSKEDRDFIEDAGQGGLLEVKLGQLVVKQGSSDEVKRFAQRMVDDHTKLNARLAETARQVGATAPQELDKKRQDQYDKMAQLSGPKLDEEYMSRTLSEHKDDVKAFQKEAKDGKDAAVRTFAAGALPLLEEHLNLVRQLHDRLQK
jgi:putative membrane protein